MLPQAIRSPLARVVIALLCLMWTVTGWYVFLDGSFTTSPKRSNVSTTVTGLGAEFIGVVFIVLGLLAAVLLLQNLQQVTRSVRVMLACVLVVLPPLLLKALWFTP